MRRSKCDPWRMGIDCPLTMKRRQPCSTSKACYESTVPMPSDRIFLYPPEWTTQMFRRSIQMKRTCAAFPGTGSITCAADRVWPSVPDKLDEIEPLSLCYSKDASSWTGCSPLCRVQAPGCCFRNLPVNQFFGRIGPLLPREGTSTHAVKGFGMSIMNVEHSSKATANSSLADRLVCE